MLPMGTEARTTGVSSNCKKNDICDPIYERTHIVSALKDGQVRSPL